MMDEDDVWFEQKRFGYGAGLPVKWQGWALLLGFIAVIVGLNAFLRDRHPALLVAIILLTTVPVVVIAARHTRGGWRWRW